MHEYMIYKNPIPNISTPEIQSWMNGFCVGSTVKIGKISKLVKKSNIISKNLYTL